MNSTEASTSSASSAFRRYARLLAIVAACAIEALASSAHAEPVTTYKGMCNASAGIDLGSNYFIVADDDINTLVIYRYGTPDRVGEVGLGTYLVKGDGTKQADLEGAARIGDRIYWIASHASKDNGEPRPKRRRLFATRIDTSGAVPTVAPLKSKPYGGLLDALASDKRFKVLTDATKTGPEAFGGFNIEGLAATEDGGLLIGFRNPLTDEKLEALVLELKNPAAVVERGAKPVFGDLIPLDLGHRGIRSIERIGGEYFIVAGPYNGGAHGDPSSRFAIYKWNRASGAPPVHWKDIEPSNFHAEGLFEIAGTRQLYLLSDDGDDNKVCKEGADRYRLTDDKTFRGMAIDR